MAAKMKAGKPRELDRQGKRRTKKRTSTKASPSRARRGPPAPAQKTGLNTPFRVNAAQIASLTDEQFKEFVKALVRAERTSLALPDGAVLFGDEIRAPDAGADALTDFQGKTVRPVGRAAERVFIPEGEAVWQFKAEKKAPTEAQFRKEMRKGQPKECLKNGGSYVFVSQQPNTATAQRECERTLKRVAKELGYAPTKVRFYAQSRLEEVADRHVSLARDFGNPAGFGELKAGVEWSAKSAFQAPFHAVGGRREQIEQIIGILRDPANPARVRVVGPPGVGKTRLVLEAIRRADALRSVIYAESFGDLTRDFAAALMGSNRECILVIDECRDEEALKFALQHEAILPRIRLITIGHLEDERRELFDAKTLVIDMIPLKGPEIASILEDSHPRLAPDRRLWVAEKTEGFVKLAELLADAVQLRPDLDLAGVDEITETAMYLERLFGSQKSLTLFQAMSLFSRIGVDGSQRAQLDRLRVWLEMPWPEVDQLVSRAETANILSHVGSYRYVTPELLSEWLITSFLRVSSTSIIRFVSELPSDMLALVAPRIAKLASGAASGERTALASALVTAERPFGKLESLEDPNVARAFMMIARAVPVAATEKIVVLVGARSREDLRRLTAGRRALVNVAQGSLWRPETFERAFVTLLNLALAENEPQLGNNATAILAHVFLAMFGPTQVPYTRRLELARELYGSGDHDARRVLVAAVATGLRHDEVGHVMGPNGTLDDNWHPRTRGELREVRAAALDFVVAALDDEHPDVKKTASASITGAARSLVAQGLSGQALSALERVAQDRQLVPSVRTELQHVLAFDREGLAPDVVAKVRSAYESLPADLESRVRAAISTWDILDDKLRDAAGLSRPADNRELAREIISSPAKASLTRLLLEPAAKNAGGLVWALGEEDEQGNVRDTVIESAHSAANPWAAGLYTAAAISRSRPSAIAWVEAALGREGFDREVAIRALTATVPPLKLLDRLTGLVEERRVPVAWLAGIVYGGWTTRVPVDGLGRLLVALAQFDEPSALEIALGATNQAIFRHIQLPVDTLTEIALRTLPVVNRNGWEWAQVAGAIAQSAPVELASAIIKAAVDTHALLGDQVSEVFNKCVSVGGSAVARVALDAVVVKGKYDPYVLDVLEKSSIIQVMTIDAMITWASRNGRAGQLVLAKLVPPSPSPETCRALERFGADSMFGEVLASEVSGGVIVGDVAQHYAASASTADRWASDESLPQVFRSWAARVVARERAMRRSWEEWRREEDLLRKLDS